MSFQETDSNNKASMPPYVKSKCPDCDFIPPTRERWEEHRLTHTCERPFACPTCDQRFAAKAYRDKHVKRVHLKADRIPCSWSGCQKTFAEAHDMGRHVSSIHLKERIACPVAGCSHASSRKSYLVTHIKAIHKKSRVDESRQLACLHDGCDFRTSWSQSLINHEKSVHKKMVRHTCHVCGKGFYLKSTFRGHQQVHAKQGHLTDECISCRADLVKGSKRSSLVSQEEQPSSSSDDISDLLTSVHLDMHLLSSRNH